MSQNENGCHIVSRRMVMYQCPRETCGTQVYYLQELLSCHYIFRTIPSQFVPNLYTISVENFEGNTFVVFQL